MYAFLWMVIFSCIEKDFEELQPLQDASKAADEIGILAVTLDEGFETGSKTTYAPADVSLASGAWNFSDALIGKLSSDRKNGTQSVRMRNSGRITMNYDLSGATTVRVLHAAYGTDGASSWQLWMSTNGGTDFSQAGPTVSTSSISLNMATFSISVSGPVRFEIRKVTGGPNRINFDDFQASTSGSPGVPPGDDSSLLFGNPSNAAPNTSSPNNYLMDKTYYALSYNRSRATANWVCWHVGSGSQGNTSRQNDFRADISLPSGWYQAGSTSYSGSGFDRGHNCPSADRTSSVTANSSTFLMTNMVPQAPSNNRYLWANFESYVRSLVDGGMEAYLIMGCYGTGGSGSNGPADSIDNGRIIVPNRIWKVVLIIQEGPNDLSRVSTSTRVIAINTPNTNSVNNDWRSYLTTVDAIESATGYDLLSALPDNIESVLESTVDNASM